MDQGWIKLYRQIREHWIYKNAEYYKAWTTILMMVNHEEHEILIQNEVYTCARGQSLLSLNHWAKTFGKLWTVQKVRSFFSLLKKHGMINTEGLHKTTRLTVLKYDFYQGSQQADNRQATLKKQGKNRELTTNKNVKNEKEKRGIVCLAFEQFHKKYPGIKRSLDTELENFLETNSPEIIPQLLPALEKEIDYHKNLQGSGQFVPSWKNLSTWIKQKCWEQEFMKANITSQTDRLPRPSSQHVWSEDQQKWIVQ